MSDRIDLVLGRAIAAGLLPADAARPTEDARPWPVLLLTGLGAWLAAIPLLIVVALLLGDLITRGVGPYLIGVLVLAAAVVVLRGRGVPLFFEQLAVPALLVGGGSLGFGLFRDLPDRGASAVLAAVALALGLAIARPWLRLLLGAAAAALGAFAVMPQMFRHGLGADRSWYALHGILALWLAVLWLQAAVLADGARARAAAAVESLAAGWLLTALAGLAVASGMTFLVGASLGGELSREVARGFGARQAGGATASLSAALALLACALAAQRWAGLRLWRLLPVAAVAAVLAWFMPMLGGALLALALTATTQRYRLALAAALAAAWIVGSFYYRLNWPLTTKAAVLAGCGALLGALAWLGHERKVSLADTPRRAGGREAGLIALAAVATLAVANFGIWQKEALIARGRPVFVELAPRDPRSLMQGDFMSLNFRLPAEAMREAESLLARERPRLVGRLDARGVASLLRLQRADAPLAADEFLVELTPMDGRWGLVSDAWFFKEGEARRWEAARYGEFRIDADGRALLVGLADANLAAIRP